MTWSIAALLVPLMMIPVAFCAGNFDRRIIQYTLGPRYPQTHSLGKLLKVDLITSLLGTAVIMAAFGVVSNLFNIGSTRYFYLTGTLFLYFAIFSIGWVHKREADKLIKTIRAGRDLPKGVFKKADANLIKQLSRLPKDTRIAVIAPIDELLKPKGEQGDKQKADQEAQLPATQGAFFWLSFAFLVVLPIYGLLFVYHFSDWIVGIANAIGLSKQVENAGPIDLFHFLFIQKVVAACPDDDVKGCAKALAEIQAFQTLTPIMALQFAYYFLITFFPLRYLIGLWEYKALVRWTKNKGLGLETDVVKKSGAGVSAVVSLILALVLVNVPLGQIGVFSGIAAAGLSVALRDTLGNLLAGALLIWDGTLKKGDVITLPRSQSSDTGSSYGIVREMRMRYTIVEDRNTVRRLIPNATLVGNQIESWTHEDRRVRLSLRIGVAYGTDLREAKQVMESVCYDVPRILSEKAPQALVVDYGESAIQFSLRFWLRDTSDGIRPVISEVLINLWERFEERKMEIPFPRRDIHLYNHGNVIENLEPRQDAVENVEPVRSDNA